MSITVNVDLVVTNTIPRRDNQRTSNQHNRMSSPLVTNTILEKVPNEQEKQHRDVVNGCIRPITITEVLQHKLPLDDYNKVLYVNLPPQPQHSNPPQLTQEESGRLIH